MRKLVWIAWWLTLVVVPLGAYVRLSDAGLGCPDWPGCYGHLSVPAAAHELDHAASRFPDQPLDAGKAWKEMIHRYAAGLLGLTILALTVAGWRRARRAGLPPPALETTLAAVLVLQALLGMWTVTLLLKPAVVTLHLIGGMSTLALLTVLLARERGLTPVRLAARARWGVGLVLVAVVGQVLLGGWVSSNYAALACGVQFPACRGEWLPDGMLFRDSFHVWRALGETASGALLSSDHLTAIHWLHRAGAGVVTLSLGLLLVRLWPQHRLRRHLLALGVLLLTQLLLGMANVLLQLPLPLAVAHNAVGAWLLAGVVLLGWRVWQSAAQTVSDPSAAWSPSCVNRY